MRLGHPNYIKLVIGTYKKKRANNELSILLSQPTPANIRQECANVYKEGCEKKDEPTLRAFFGPGQQGKKFLDIIEGFDLPKFKPLVLYLKKNGRKKITDKSLELLAWLIDIKHRPFVFDREVILSEEELLIINDKDPVPDFVGPEPEDDDFEPNAEGDEEESDIPEKPVVGPATTEAPKELPIAIKSVNDTGTNQELTPKGKNDRLSLKVPIGKKRNRLKMAVAAILIAATCIGGTYMVGQRERPKPLSLGNISTGCMYWAGDHYDTMSCAEKRSDRFPLPLDAEKMRNFKRITKEDTITEKSIGRIYYIRIDGRIEYYTMGGHHPVDVTRTLKVLSSYMFFKHLDKQEIADKNPASGEKPQFINNR